MPGLELDFWGWDSPVLPKAVHVLMERAEGSGMLLSDCVVLVPTAEAGRRLREAMAQAAAEQGRAISMPYVWHPEIALTFGTDRRRVASKLQERLAWTGVLVKLAPAECASLFPALSANPGYAWALSVAETLVELRKLLGGGGHTMAAVAESPAAEAESERWQDLAKLEARYLDALSRQELTDRQAQKAAQAEAALLPEGVTQVLVFAVVDPPGLLRTWLDRVAQGAQVRIHVQAPEGLAKNFDALGIPRPESWGGHAPYLQRDVDERCIWLVPRPQDQARTAVQLVRDLVGQSLTPAVGTCDPQIGDHLVSAFLAENVQAYDPADRLALEHSLVGLIRAWMAFAESGAWRPLAAFLRLDDVVEAVLKADEATPAVPSDAAPDAAAGKKSTASKKAARAAKAAVSDPTAGAEANSAPVTTASPRVDAWSASAYLRAIDEALARHLPPTLSEALTLLRDEAHFGNLKPILEQVHRQWNLWRQGNCELALRSLLEWIYGERIFKTQYEVDAEMGHLMGEVIYIAASVDAAVAQLGEPVPFVEQCGLVLEELEATPLSDTRGEVDLVLQGWLELLWEPAPGLVVTGFNEDYVPGILVSHPFLPDTMRRELGLTSQITRRSRDSYLLTALIEQRRQGGVVHTILGKVDQDNNALKPSRLLFNCPDSALPGRIRRLFPGGEETPEEPEPAWRRAWLLKPRRQTPRLDTISVSGLNAYLACPFRYYLGRVLGSGEVDPWQRELTPGDFGELLHQVLAAYARSPISQTPHPEREIVEWLEKTLEQMAAQRYGHRPFFSVTLQIEALRLRLTSVARELVKLYQESWSIVAPELRIDETWGLKLGESTFVGRIDRLDVRQEPDGRVYRIWDYKTGATAPRAYTRVRYPGEEGPSNSWQCMETTDGRTLRWQDLQLPLYAWAVRCQYPDAVRVEAAYLMISADSGSATPKFLKEEVGEEAIGNAVRCAEEVVSRIRGGIFWPPAEKVRYDDAAALWLGDDPANAVDPEWMESLKKPVEQMDEVEEAWV